MLVAKSLQFQYSDQQQFNFPDLNFERGSHWLILGESGCGKSTLLHLLGALRKAQKGSVAINGQNLKELSEDELDLFRGQNVGIIFQQAHLIQALTLEENILAAQYLAKNQPDKNKVQQLLERLNLSKRAQAKPTELSLGEQQRAAIARALINDPILILADEPTSSLDDKNCEEVLNLLLEQSQAYNATLVIVTHDARLKDKIANRIELTTVDNY